MKRLAIIVVFFFLLASTASAAIDGAWTAVPSEKRPGKLSFSLHHDRHHQNGTSFDVSTLGLTDAQVFATTATPVQFQLRREAGIVSFEGSFRNGNGAGQFSFAPNRSYENSLRALGVKLELDHRKGDDDSDLFSLALFDVSTGFIRSMQAEGYRVSLEKYLALRIFGVTPAYIREMESLGYPDLSADKLIETKIHKVTPQFIRELRDLGYDNISPTKLVEMRIHKVTPEFIRQLADAGYRNVPIQKLINMRIHRIEPEMVKRLNDAAR